MNKKIEKIVSIVLIAVMMISIAATSFAAPIDPSTITGDSSVTGSSEIQKVGKSIVGILQTVGVVLSVVILIVIGIKYMMGSAAEKSEYKKTLMPYVIGAALIFAASSLAQVIYQFFNNVSA